MVGDDLYGDVIGGSEAGCRSVLVRTGKFQKAWESHSAPAAIVNRLSEAVDLILEAQSKWP